VKRIGLVAIVLLALSGRARADWRDGCPAGNLQSAADVTYTKAADAPGPGETNPRLLGPAPQLDSALVPTRVLLAPAYLHFEGSSDAPRAQLIGALAQVNLNAGQSAPTRAVVFGASLTVPYLNVEGNNLAAGGQSAPAPAQLGNLVLGLSLKRHWLTSFLDDRTTDARAYIAGVRNAWAVQLIGAARPWSHDADGSTILLQRTAFDAALFTPHKAGGPAFEWRSEGVGCFAPFIHVRLSVVFSKDARDQHWSIFAPQTLALGLAPSSRFTAMVQYGMVFSAYTGPAGGAGQAVLPTNVVHRIRFGVDLSGGSISAGAALDLFLNSALYDGTALVGYVAYNFGEGWGL